VGVKVPFGMRRAIGRPLMETHRIGKRNVEDAVVRGGETAHRSSHSVAFLACEPFERCDMAAR
jgi:hypothetical protein